VTPFLAAAIAEMLTDADDRACAACGYAWDIAYDRAMAEIELGPERYEVLLESAAPASPRSADEWSPSAYVWHVGDVTRAWAERLHSTRFAPGVPWAGFDPDTLAEARSYSRLPAVTSPWALEVATRALFEVLSGLEPDTAFEHPEWGRGSIGDAVRWVAHEVVHHQIDVSRGLSTS
jgi:hypothetical protein